MTRDLIVTNITNGTAYTFPFCGLNADWNCRAWRLSDDLTLVDSESGGFEVLTRDGDEIRLIAQVETAGEGVHVLLGLETLWAVRSLKRWASKRHREGGFTCIK